MPEVIRGPFLVDKEDLDRAAALHEFDLVEGNEDLPEVVVEMVGDEEAGAGLNAASAGIRIAAAAAAAGIKEQEKADQKSRYAGPGNLQRNITLHPPSDLAARRYLYCKERRRAGTIPPLEPFDGIDRKKRLLKAGRKNEENDR
jgi:hypothetical protein